MRVLGLSGISNKANLDGSTITTHEEVIEAGKVITPKVEKIVRGLGRPARRGVVAMLGLSFKPNTDDLREAPALEIIAGLKRRGVKVRAYDPVAMPGARALPQLKGVALAKDAYDELRYWFRMFDPLHEREAEVFTRLGYIDNQHLAPRIRGEVKMAVGLMDTICPPSTQFAAYNRMKCPKSLLVYPDFGHEGLPWIGDRAVEFLAGL